MKLLRAYKQSLSISTEYPVATNTAPVSHIDTFIWANYLLFFLKVGELLNLFFVFLDPI